MPDSPTAARLAVAARAAILHLLDEGPAEHIHLFLATPGGFALLLGHRWNALRPPTVYEHLGGGRGYGHDTDTVAAIAGGLLGARWGCSALPFAWRLLLHGWPGYRARDLVRLAVLTAGGGIPDQAGWPSADSLAGHYRQTAGHAPLAEALPDDLGLVVGNVEGLPAADIDAVVSLCRVGRTFAPAPSSQLSAAGGRSRRRASTGGLQRSADGAAACPGAAERLRRRWHR